MACAISLTSPPPQSLFPRLLELLPLSSAAASAPPTAPRADWLVVLGGVVRHARYGDPPPHAAAVALAAVGTAAPAAAAAATASDGARGGSGSARARLLDAKLGVADGIVVDEEAGGGGSALPGGVAVFGGGSATGAQPPVVGKPGKPPGKPGGSIMPPCGCTIGMEPIAPGGGRIPGMLPPPRGIRPGTHAGGIPGSPGTGGIPAMAGCGCRCIGCCASTPPPCPPALPAAACCVHAVIACC